MSSATYGIYGTDVTYKDAFLYSFPVIGVIVSAVKLRHVWGSQFGFKSYVALPPTPRENSNHNATLGASEMAFLNSYNKDFAKDKIYLICGIVSSILTLAVMGALLGSDVFGWGVGWHFSLLTIPVATLIAYSYGLYHHQPGME